jgi:hypothetical protein
MTVQPLEPRRDFPAELGRWPVILTAAAQLAERVANTEFVPRNMRGKPEVIVAAIMYGDELGIGPMQALAGINLVEGRPAPSAELLRALILRDGHQIVVHEMSPHRCRVSGLRAGADETTRVYVEWNLDMAKAAGLAGKQNWRQYPRAMLLARATSDLARAAFPDVVRGLGYIAETADSAQNLESWAGPEPAALEPGTPPAGEDSASESYRPPVAPDGQQRRTVQRQTQPRRSKPVESAELPDLPPEPQPPEPPTGPRDKPGVPTDAPMPEGPQRITEAPLRAIHTKVGMILGTAPNQKQDRAQRLALLEAIIGHKRRLESSSDLTRAEGYTVLEWLDRITNGEAWHRVNDDGQYEVGLSDQPMFTDANAPPGYEVEDLPAPDPWQDPEARERELLRAAAEQSDHDGDENNDHDQGGTS